MKLTQVISDGLGDKTFFSVCEMYICSPLNRSNINSRIYLVFKEVYSESYNMTSNVIAL